MTHRWKNCYSYLLALLLAWQLTPASADVTLPSVFSDHMVLQQQQPVRVWGWADAGQSVEVHLGENSATTTPDATGRWQVELPPLVANSQPQSLVVRGGNTIEIQDVLIGEVWLCSGQSNMEWTVGRSANAAEEIASAKYPLIRQIAIPKTSAFLPQKNVIADWRVCSPETVSSFTACGYFMARHLHQELDVPIGLINSSWGGTRVEPWTPPVGFKQVDALQSTYDSVMTRTPGTPAYQERLDVHIAATQAWIETAKQSPANATLLAPNPTFPTELIPFATHQDPTMLFNGMIYPVLGFPIRGAIWYQGESNHNEGMLYFEKKKALIGGWRELWQQGDFPFYYVQIAPFQYGSEDPTILATFWEAQAAVQQIPNTAMVVINDIATLNDIHPPGKQEVGRRLALLALKNDYGRDDVIANSPEMESLEVLDDRLKVIFKNTGGGLKTRDGRSPTHFEIVGSASAGFQVATAEIDGDSVILKSDLVKKPVAFRFAWHKLAEPNLMGGTGLPVGAVRGGELPDFVNTLPIGDDYKLVYDLDLSKLGPTISYDVDNSNQIQSFDRIAYLVELATGSGNAQNLFVSMDAFTDDIQKIGIPTVQSGAHFACGVKSLDVYSNVTGITTGTSLATGNIEFWPNNYTAQNAAGVQGANKKIYDWGDAPAEPVDGYGSMQVHNFAAGQTLFAINKWSSGAKADLGIGNSSGQAKDWTFSSNAETYTSKRLRVYVRTK